MPRPLINVLLVATPRPNAAELSGIVDQLHAHGASVRLATHYDLPDGFFGVRPDEVHSWVKAAPSHGPAFRRALHRTPPAKRPWLYAEHDEWVNEQTRRASIIFALDKRSIPFAHKLVARHRGAVAVSDLDEAIRCVQHNGTARRPITSPRSWDIVGALPAWAARALVGWPFMADRRRYQIARSAALQQLRLGRPANADRIVLRALNRLGSLRQRADLLGDVVNAVLAQGRTPALALNAYSAELKVADRHLSKGHHREAAESFTEASRVAFHRALHFDGLTSPLAADPADFTAPLRDSTTAQALSAPRGRALPAATRRPDRPMRVLIATRINANFLGEIRNHLSAHPAFDVRFVDFGLDAELNRWAEDEALIPDQILGPDSTLAERIEAEFRPHLDWADVVFVEWSTVLPVMLTMIDPRDTRIIVRLHSHEAFTHWPHLIDFTRVDDLVFVSDHIRDLAIAAIPALSRGGAPRTHVLPNAMSPRRFVRAKHDSARFTLALVGWSQVAKDPRWAIEVVRLLRGHDERYRLLLIGSEFRAGVSTAARAYGEGLRRDLDSLEPSGAVERFGRTDDVAAALSGVGVILSTSVRESFHAGLVEGAASGAIPVVRDWPFFAGKANGARTLFPAEWVVGSPDEAAARILRTTASEDVWREVGGAAADFAIERWDWDKVKLDYERLLAPGGTD